MQRPHYKKYLKSYARTLRQQGILSEVLLWQAIKNKSLGVRFNRQVPVLAYVVDFYCIPLKLVVEIDGASHDDIQYQKDMERQQNLERTGILVVRYRDGDVRFYLNQVLEGLAVIIERLQHGDRSKFWE